MKYFTTGLLAFTIFLGGVSYLLWFILPGHYFSPALPYLFPFFFLLTYLVYFILTQKSEKAFSNFVNRFMIALFSKMILCVILLLIYVFTHRPDAVPFILAFFILYVLFSIFEVIALLKHPFPGKK